MPVSLLSWDAESYADYSRVKHSCDLDDIVQALLLCLDLCNKGLNVFLELGFSSQTKKNLVLFSLPLSNGGYFIINAASSHLLFDAATVRHILL